MFYLDGKTGALLYTWKASFLDPKEDEKLGKTYISKMLFIQNYLVTTHEPRKPPAPGERAAATILNYWIYDAEADDPDADYIDASDVFRLHTKQDIEDIKGITTLTATGAYKDAILCTSDGFVYKWELPSAEEALETKRLIQEEIDQFEVEESFHKLQPVLKSHMNFVTAACFLEGQGESPVIVTADEFGTVQVTDGNALSLVRFRAGIQQILSLRQDLVLVASETGVLRVLAVPALSSEAVIAAQQEGWAAVTIPTEKSALRVAENGFASVALAKGEGGVCWVFGALWNATVAVLSLTGAGGLELHGFLKTTVPLESITAWMEKPTHVRVAGIGTEGGEADLGVLEHGKLFVFEVPTVLEKAQELNSQCPVAAVQLIAEATCCCWKTEPKNPDATWDLFVGYVDGAISQLGLPPSSLQLPGPGGVGDFPLQVITQRPDGSSLASVNLDALHETAEYQHEQSCSGIVYTL